MRIRLNGFETLPLEKLGRAGFTLKKCNQYIPIPLISHIVKAAPQKQMNVHSLTTARSGLFCDLLANLGQSSLLQWCMSLHLADLWKLGWQTGTLTNRFVWYEGNDWSRLLQLCEGPRHFFTWRRLYLSMAIGLDFNNWDCFHSVCAEIGQDTQWGREQERKPKT